MTNDASDRRPDPDPTRLTQEAFTRAEVAWNQEIEAAKALLFAAIKRVEDIREVQILRLEEKMGAVETLTMTRFAERDKRFDQADRDHQKSLDAALTSANEQIKQLNLTSGVQSTAINERVGDIRAKLTALESITVTKSQTSNDIIGRAIAIVSLIIAAVSVIYATHGAGLSK